MQLLINYLSTKFKSIFLMSMLSFSTVIGQNLITNGGFESGNLGWSSQAGGGGSATFNLSTNEKKEGTQSYQVAVSTLGASSYSIQTQGPSWSATLYNTYVISFWAKSSVAGAKINIVQQNQNYAVKTFTLTSSWTQYQYEFVAFETAPQFKIQYLSLGTYNIDVISVSATSIAPLTGMELKTMAARCNLNFGAAVSDGALQNDADYINSLKRDFSIVVAENAMKMGALKPTETGAYNFGAADRLVNFALANGIKVRGHTLLWHSQLPGWVETKTWTKATLLAYLKDYITTVVGRYKGKITEWDVANECIDDASGNPLRNSVWFKVIGEEVLDSAFKWTNQIDPNAKLFYNDYNAETINGKSNAVYALVSRLKSRKVPIHGVGFQSHVGYTTAPTMTSNWIVQADQNIKRLGALGLQVSITELDLGIPAPFDATKYATQAVSYSNILRLALKNPTIVKTFTLWGFTDKYSWIPGFSQGKNGAALIMYDDFTPKPAYQEIVKVLTSNCPVPITCTAKITTTSPSSFCAGGKVELTTNKGSKYKWYNGTLVVVTTPSYTASSGGNYKVEVTYSNGCKATSSSLAVVVNPLPVASVSALGASTICEGNSVTLTANTSSSYNWKRNGINVGISRSFVATATGSYLVEIRDSKGCTDASPITTVSVLGVNQASVNIKSSATAVCSGTSVTVTATSINGGTSPTYTWFKNNIQQGQGTTFTISPQNGDQVYAKLAVGGSLPVCLSSTNALSNSIDFNVNPLPILTPNLKKDSELYYQPNTANAIICDGDGITFAPWPVTTTSWTWTGPNGFTSNIRNPKVSPMSVAQSGKYTATYLDLNGCSAKISFNVTVNPIKTWYADADGDGKGDATSTVQSCNQPAGYVAVTGDACPLDASKTTPGNCGCGISESVCAPVPAGTYHIKPLNNLSYSLAAGNTSLVQGTSDATALNQRWILVPTGAVGQYSIKNVSTKAFLSPNSVTFGSRMNAFSTTPFIWKLEFAGVTPEGIGTFRLLPSNDLTKVVYNKTATAINLFLGGIADIPNQKFVLESFSSAISRESSDSQESSSLQAGLYPNPFENQVRIQANGSFTYTVTNLAGLEIEKGAGENQVITGQYWEHGMYFVHIQTGEVSMIQKVVKE